MLVICLAISAKLSLGKNLIDEFNLDKMFYFKWYQIIHTIPSSWKLNLLNDNGNC